MKKIILASASPRRKELLEQIGLSFQIEPARGEEHITSVIPREVVEELSYQKAMEVAQLHKEEDTLILGADTIVVYDDKIMGKPSDEEDAKEMLRKLSGRTHCVFTGVTAVLWTNQKKTVRTFSEKTEVTFYPMSEEEIMFYVKTKEPMDKAGAYGIQGIGAKYIQAICGDYNNVVGLPVARLYQEVLRDWIW
ncbi:MAG: Maf family protein [Eubacteriales bacterium]|nr:Maf family protein [Eubacteriales bacterium]